MNVYGPSNSLRAHFKIQKTQEKNQGPVKKKKKEEKKKAEEKAKNPFFNKCGFVS